MSKKGDSNSGLEQMKAQTRVGQKTLYKYWLAKVCYQVIIHA